MKRLFIFFAIAALATASSCKKILEQKPEGSLDAGVAYTTRQGVEAGILGIYDAFQSVNYYGVRFGIFADMGADGLTHTGTFPTFAQIFNRQILADNTETTNMWNVVYNGINRANTVIASVPAINDPAFNKAVALAEARCLRSVMYFDLLRSFGGSDNGFNKGSGVGVPIFTAPTLAPGDAAAKARNSETEVWALIIADIDEAIANLPTVSANGRVNRNVATALKARYELYREQWANAETLATTVINQFSAQPNGGLTTNMVDLYAAKNIRPESLWELQFFADDAGSHAFFYYTTALGGRNEVSSSAGLNAAHEAGDLRRAINVTVATAGPPAVPGNKTRKFFRVDGSDNFIVLRLAELYLIRAEARIRKASPDIAGAQADLNRVRNRSGLANTTAATVADLLTAIEQERRIELAHEGHRWYDLRRYNKITTLPGVSQSFRALWPIPLREVQTSAGLVVQNTGY